MAAWKNKGHIMNGSMEEQGAHYEWQHGRTMGYIVNGSMEEQGGTL